MTRPIGSDPLRNFQYRVMIHHQYITSFVQLGFMSVSGLSVQNQVIPYREGGNNTTTRKMPGQTDFGALSLTRGMLAAPVSTSNSSGSAGSFLAPMNSATVNSQGQITGGGSFRSTEAYVWFTQIFAAQAGTGASFYNTKGKVQNYNFRYTVTIDLMEHPITFGTNAAGVELTLPVKARYTVYNAWPMGLSYSDLEAGGNAVVIENLQLAHEGWELETASTSAASFIS